MAAEGSLVNIWKPLLVLVVGLVLIGYGLSIDPSHPRCGSSPMSPGQICETTLKGVPRRQSYDDLVAEARTRRLGFPIGGGVVALAGVGWAAALLVRRRRAAGAPSGARASDGRARSDGRPPSEVNGVRDGASHQPSAGRWVRRGGGSTAYQPGPDAAPMPGPPWPRHQPQAGWPQHHPSAPVRSQGRWPQPFSGPTPPRHPR